MSVSSQILDAIELLTQNSIKKAAYDKTIQAQIISCEDETIGKYKCRYQDAIIYAYSNSIDTKYSEKAYVYILVPDNDMSKEKTILGTANKLGINYISQAEGEQAYDIVGANCISTNTSIYLNTAIDKYRYKIYPNENNFITIDSQINNYIKDSSSLLVGATFKTNIQPEKQYRGHYGIQFNLKFIDNETNEEVIRTYILDQDNMIGNPYRLTTGIRQYEIFDIDGENFESIDSIEIFCQDFFDAEDPTKEQNFSGFNLINEEDADIFISSLELLGMNRMTQDEIGGVSISFFTPRGTIFDTNNNLQEIPITAQVKVKGKIASSAQNIPFYWGSENASIFANNRYYNKYLGKGWKCLNDSNVIEEDKDKTTPSVVEWVAKGNTYVVKLNAATAKNNKFKVAILYDSNIITKEINIQNLTGTASEITIESDGGTQFYYDNGHPTLTCKIDGEEKLQYSYYWAYQSSSNGFQELTETTDENSLYERYSSRLEDCKKGYIEVEKNNIIKLENKLKEFKYIQRVKKNKIYDVQINKIISRGTFKCSVYNGNLYLGTATITLTNKLESQGQYSLVINNGDAAFQYNEEGHSPTRGSLEKPQQLQSLSFTLYDNLGNIIDSDTLIKDKNCTVRWEFPIKDTLLKDVLSNKETNVKKDQQGYYNYYYNRANIIYQISDNYDIKKQRNQIKLFINYKGIKLNASTNFTFVKVGQPGTNGTEYIVKIVLNTKMDNPPLYPMITKIGSNGYKLNYGCNSKQLQTDLYVSKEYNFFNVELWNNGEIIQKNIDDFSYSIKWEILQNQYSSQVKDESILILSNSSSGAFQINTTSFNSFSEKKAFANIVKCSISIKDKKTEIEKTYYGTIPVITAWAVSDDYRFGLKDYTGFKYVLYDSSGKFPQYDNTNPFEFIFTKTKEVKRAINILQENLEQEKITERINLSQSDDIEYIPSFVGSYKIKNNEVSSNMFQKGEVIKNQYKIKPKSIYDGFSVNNAITCVFKQKQEGIVGKINIPVHFLLNKYGLADINQWDGNNIQIDEDKGFILSPQVGAGKKDPDNGFSGVLMGGVKNPNLKNTQMGLFGYYHGERTIFLNSDNGSAAFGRSGAGQIIIDPTQNNNQEALIYGGNYNDDPINGTGMLINLSKPFIKFGNGDFKVDDKGHLTAKGGGQIAGWKIGTETIDGKVHNILYSNKTKANGRITLDSYGNGKIYSHDHDTLSSDSSTGFYLSYDGLSIGSKIKISNTGIVTVGSGAVTNKSQYHWTINGDTSRAYIAYGGETKVDTADGTTDNSAKVYLGTDGISLGKRFSVTAQGSLRAYSGVIGGWTIGSTTLSANKIIINSSGTISGGNYDAEKEQGWQITGKGQAEFYKATIRGKVTANSGSVGGWTIGKNSLTSKNSMITLHAGSTDSKTDPYIRVGIKSTFTSYIDINSDGSIISQNYSSKDSTGWKIDGEGNAVFNQGVFGPWKIGKDDKNTKVFEGNTAKGASSIRFYANGDVYGKNIKKDDDKSGNYWQIINSQAYFGNGLIIGPMKYKANKKGWNINSTRILSYSDKATIQIGPDGKTATIKYTTEGKRPAITLGSPNITANVDGKLTAKSADIATFDNKTSATFRGNVTFGNKGSVIFNGGVNKEKSLSAYIKKIIDNYVNESFLKGIVNKKYLQNYLESASLLSNVVTSANKLSGTVSGTNVTISGYSNNNTVTGLKWK